MIPASQVTPTVPRKIDPPAQKKSEDCPVCWLLPIKRVALVKQQLLLIWRQLWLLLVSALCYWTLTRKGMHQPAWV